MAARGSGRSSPGARPPGLGERAIYKIILQRQFADLRVEGLDIHRPVERAPLSEHRGRAGQELLPPLANLGRMDIEALGQLRQRGLASHGGKGDLGLEGRGVITTGTTGQRMGSRIEGRKIVRGARLSSYPTCSELRSHLFAEPPLSGRRGQARSGSLPSSSYGGRCTQRTAH